MMLDNYGLSVEDDKQTYYFRQTQSCSIVIESAFFIFEVTLCRVYLLLYKEFINFVV